MLYAYRLFKFLVAIMIEITSSSRLLNVYIRLYAFVKWLWLENVLINDGRNMYDPFFMKELTVYY